MAVVLRGALAASVTPLRDDGEALDEAAFVPLVEFLVGGGLDGILVLGTTGEGIMLTVPERRRATELFVRSVGGRISVAVHCGAQTTADTVSLASHAAESGADAVAVIGPPYFAFDEEALFRHFRDAASACQPLPFYVYEFAARSGYAVPVTVIDRLRAAVSNLAGLKVSDRPWDRFSEYLLEGLDVFVGPESLIVPGLGAGAVGAVSGLASGFPELVAALVRQPSAESGERVTWARAQLESFPFHSAIKAVLAERGVPLRPDVRAPLRALSEDERERVAGVVRSVVVGA